MQVLPHHHRPCPSPDDRHPGHDPCPAVYWHNSGLALWQEAPPSCSPTLFHALARSYMPHALLCTIMLPHPTLSHALLLPAIFSHALPCSQGLHDPAATYCMHLVAATQSRPNTGRTAKLLVHNAIIPLSPHPCDALTLTGDALLSCFSDSAAGTIQRHEVVISCTRQGWRARGRDNVHEIRTAFAL